VIRARAAGDAAVLLELTAGEPAALAAQIRAAGLTGLVDVVPGASTVLVLVEPGSWQIADLAAGLERLHVPAADPAASLPVIDIPVRYDGRDLAEVAAMTGLSPDAVTARHQAAEYEVGWLGFSPGFGYLRGLDPALARVPRRGSPRLSVPGGSVAIAGGFTAVYPAASPGGWRLIGRTSAVLWDPDRDPPALLAPGRRVRFHPVDDIATASQPVPASQPLSASVQDAPDGPALEILQPGPLTTVQDLGRPGLGHLGVPRSGAADPGSLRWANELAGNEPAAACLEVTLGRLAVRFDGPAVVALTGAPAPVRLTGPDGSQREQPAGRAFEVTAGTRLRLGAPPAGLRSYLAVAGGIQVRPVLGSRSADLLSGLGPAPLRAGQRLALGTPRSAEAPSARDAAATAARRLPGPGDSTQLRVIAGPRSDWFDAAALATLTSASYLLTAASDRTGLRLSGPPLHRATSAELGSEGVATGSLQVSHDGMPILLLADHPVTGGYPVIAVVCAADVELAGQLRPGQRVSFRLAGPTIKRDR